jgi:hypothetical protein
MLISMMRTPHLALVLTLAASSATAARHGTLTFISDDYSRALAEARQARLPLFVEAWAPW